LNNGHTSPKDPVKSKIGIFPRKNPVNWSAPNVAQQVSSWTWSPITIFWQSA